ncbi:DUF2837 family protein [Bacillus licheniformis]|nr:DUF2837 family protein [Bacillus licheniformis]
MIHSIETLAYAARLSGARVGFIASALSLFNVMVIVSRMSNMVQQPVTGKLVDVAGRMRFPSSAANFVFDLWFNRRHNFGMLLLPTFVAVFRERLFIGRRNGSVCKCFARRFKNSFKHAKHYAKDRAWNM